LVGQTRRSAKGLFQIDNFADNCAQRVRRKGS
jgi:hypothetical protein